MLRLSSYLCAWTVGILFLATEILGASSLRVPSYESTILPNGMKLFLMPNPKVPMVYVSIGIRDGSRSDGFLKSGIAAFTAEGLALGSKSFTKDQIEDILDFTGASLAQGTVRDYSQVDLSFRKQDAAQLLPLLADMVTRPLVPSKEVQKLRDLTVTQLIKVRESPSAFADLYFQKLIFGKSPYGWFPDGTPGSVKTFTSDDLTQHHAQYYVPRAMAISVVGDFDSKEMKNQLTTLFGRWQGSPSGKSVGEASRKRVQAAAEPSEPRVLLVRKDDANETTFRIGGRGFSRDCKDFVQISVINTALGGRFTSLLNDALRVKSGLTYGARSGFESMREGGIFSIATYTASEQSFKAIDLALATYRDFLTKGLDAQTLDSAKAYVKGQFPPRFETMQSWAHYLLDTWVYDLPERWLDSFEQEVDALTETRAKELIQTYFPKENLQMVVIGKPDLLKHGLSKYGRVVEKEMIDVEQGEEIR